MSRKLLLDPYLAIHGKIMAKNGHFFMEFWPIFDIFHRLRPYLCSKAQDLGFHKQATHRRHDDEPLGQKNHFCLKWSKRVQMGPKGLITISPMCGLLVEPQIAPFGTWIWSQYMKNVKNRSKFHEKWLFLPLSCHEWQGMGPKEGFYSYLVPEMIW